MSTAPQKVASRQAVSENDGYRVDTFKEACRRADKEQRHKPDNPRHDGAASSTVEALMFSLRRGVGALAEPASQRRLSELSEEQLCEVYARVQKFKERIAPAWSEADADGLLALWRDLGQDA
jgi:hypothetical protein